MLWKTTLLYFAIVIFLFFSNYQQFQNQAYKKFHSLLLSAACIFSSDKVPYKFLVASEDLDLYFCSLLCGLLKIFGVVNLKNFKLRRWTGELGKILVMLRDPYSTHIFIKSIWCSCSAIRTLLRVFD
jgi:hypothetical protein